MEGKIFQERVRIKKKEMGMKIFKERKTIPASEVGMSLTISDETLKKLDEMGLEQAKLQDDIASGRVVYYFD